MCISKFFFQFICMKALAGFLKTNLKETHAPSVHTRRFIQAIFKFIKEHTQANVHLNVPSAPNPFHRKQT